eukprot:scaffold18203_cov90-Isochrysis_galbana.AAC.2
MRPTSPAGKKETTDSNSRGSNSPRVRASTPAWRRKAATTAAAMHHTRRPRPAAQPARISAMVRAVSRNQPSRPAAWHPLSNRAEARGGARGGGGGFSREAGERAVSRSAGPAARRVVGRGGDQPDHRPVVQTHEQPARQVSRLQRSRGLGRGGGWLEPHEPLETAAGASRRQCRQTDGRCRARQHKQRQQQCVEPDARDGVVGEEWAPAHVDGSAGPTA